MECSTESSDLHSPSIPPTPFMGRGAYSDGGIVAFRSPEPEGKVDGSGRVGQPTKSAQPTDFRWVAPRKLG